MSTIRLRGVVMEDFINYKKPSLYLITSTCDFKCLDDLDLPRTICQNSSLMLETDIKEYEIEDIINAYLKNDITKAVVFGGLEPMLQFSEVREFIREFRKVSNDDVVIYTGYNKEEILPEIDELKKLGNIIVKFGRFVPNDESHFDDVLGIELISSNQYGERL